MRRQFIASLLLALLAPVFAHASVLSLQGDGVLLPETSGQHLVLMISGNDFYAFSDLQFTVNGGVGPAPAITHVFGDTDRNIPKALLVSSVWQGGGAGIDQFPKGTTTESSGLQTHVGFISLNGGAPINTVGIYAVLTLTTVGVPAGEYHVDLEGTWLASGVDEEFEYIPVPLELPDIVLRVVDEPSTIMTAAAGGVALLFFSRRRRMH
jgi:hypothetical protein